ncbi:chitodextrinase [Cytobacillus horneckiae]|uniref:fibronectin type III domain-containing protein n=1 Tax=Cytobacillus horneckiae TaxID=549687 RepID=UPI0019CF8BDE|nr:fibronectin type III domain-containing protein [Cytobacillus horneckiae]MBN6887018.1 fibronectin type III domain-containing protein [Cytobacillus horneckiae]
MAASNVTDTSANITWNAVNYIGGIKEYEVYRDGISKGKRIGTSFSDSGLTASSSYKYQVKSIANNGLESPLSSELTITTQQTPEPPPGGEG